MTWFRRQRGAGGAEPAEPGVTGGPQDDSPAALRGRLWAQVQFINAHAGRLPVASLVAARTVTDTLRAVIDSAGDGELDIYAVVQVNGIMADYLPTTLRAYLTLDAAVVDTPSPAGRTPRAALQEQLQALEQAAEELLAAARAHDADALFSQGNFLRTKFTRSDLDL